MVAKNKARKNVETPAKCNGGYLSALVESAKKSYASKMSICIDWFQAYGTCKKIPVPMEAREMEKFELDNETVLIYEAHGSEIFNYVYSIWLMGEKVATLQAHPRHTLEANAVMIKLENNLFYFSDWLAIYMDLASTLHFNLRNITRLDIAMDGNAGIVGFMSDYLKQTEGKLDVKMKGKATMKAGFKASQGGFNWFQVGSSQSEKYISIYNKTKEIEQSNKIYIKRFWENNEVDTSEDVYRIELRLKSKALAEIATDVRNLDNPAYLASICKTQMKNFFEFYEFQDNNSSRCPKLEIFDWEKLYASLLKKIEKKQVTDRYKAKLTIHLLIKLHYQDLISDYLKKKSDPYISKLIADFDLHEWYEKSQSHWKKKYYLPTNRRIVQKHLLQQLEQAGISSLNAHDYLDMQVEIDYHMCKKQGFFGNWHKFREIMNQVCNDLAGTN